MYLINNIIFIDILLYFIKKKGKSLICLMYTKYLWVGLDMCVCVTRFNFNPEFSKYQLYAVNMLSLCSYL